MQPKFVTRFQSNKHHSSERKSGTASPHLATVPLCDDRFQELIRSARAFFAEAERDVSADKAQAIGDIRRLMAEHGLTVEDLMDRPSCRNVQATPD